MLLGQPHTFFISIFHNCITPPRSDAWRVLTLPEDLSVAGFLPLSCLPARDIHLHTHPTGLRICEAECGSRWKGKASIGTPDMPHNALEGYRRFQMNVTREEGGADIATVRLQKRLDFIVHQSARLCYLFR